MKSLQTADYIVFLFYFIVVATYGYWVYRRKKKASTTV
jgi:SSS family solute:Na+ symporter